MKDLFEIHNIGDVERMLAEHATNFVARERNPLKLADILIAADYAEGADFFTCILKTSIKIARLGHSFISSKIAALSSAMQMFEWMPIEYASDYMDMADINDFKQFLSDHKIELKDGQVRCEDMLSVKINYINNLI